MAEAHSAGSDVAAGSYRCTQCGDTLSLPSATQLPPCPSCGSGSWEAAGRPQGGAGDKTRH